MSSSEVIVAGVVLALFTLQALVWELNRPRRRARWDQMIEELKSSSDPDYREEWKP